jgi:DNA-binding transcriptional regulator YdaS (Cro superfamily)
MNTKPPIAPIDRAIAILGSQQALADALGIRSPSVSEWKLRSVPAARCLAIEQATGGAVTRYELRPDVFGDAPDASEAA